MSETTSGAILQRDTKTYAIMVGNPAGIVTPADLERVSTVARKYAIPVIKLTSGQRIILAGIFPPDLPSVFADLGSLAAPDTGPCVKFVQACLGTGMCRYGSQDSIGLAGIIEERVSGISFPAKVKIGVSGCQRCCSESQIRDVGIIATIHGWIISFGGNGGTKPRIGDLIAWNLSADDTVDCVVRLLEYYRGNAKPRERTARFMERTGMKRLRSELLSLLPYIPLEKV